MDYTWRRRADSNRRLGFCRPLPCHLATSPHPTDNKGRLGKRPTRRERKTRFELATFSLARRRATTAPLPQGKTPIRGKPSSSRDSSILGCAVSNEPGSGATHYSSEPACVTPARPCTLDQLATQRVCSHQPGGVEHRTHVPDSDRGVRAAGDDACDGVRACARRPAGGLLRPRQATPRRV